MIKVCKDQLPAEQRVGGVDEVLAKCLTKTKPNTNSNMSFVSWFTSSSQGPAIRVEGPFLRILLSHA